MDTIMLQVATVLSGTHGESKSADADLPRTILGSVQAVMTQDHPVVEVCNSHQSLLSKRRGFECQYTAAGPERW